MGIAMSDITTADMLFQLNSRFAAGRPLAEMVRVQKDFNVFSHPYSLTQTFRALHIVPADFQQRRLWFKFLDRLATHYISDAKDVSGHDRIRSAYQENLESKTPLPVHMTTHRASEDRRVLVSRGRPIIYEKQSYLIISIPTIPRGEGQAARKAAKKARSKK